MEQTGSHVVLEPDPERAPVAVVPAPKSALLDYTENTPRPDEFSSDEDTLDWEGEGWS